MKKLVYIVFGLSLCANLHINSAIFGKAQEKDIIVSMHRLQNEQEKMQKAEFDWKNALIIEDQKNKILAMENAIITMQNAIRKAQFEAQRLQEFIDRAECLEGSEIYLEANTILINAIGRDGNGGAVEAARMMLCDWKKILEEEKIKICEFVFKVIAEFKAVQANADPILEQAQEILCRFRNDKNEANRLLLDEIEHKLDLQLRILKTVYVKLDRAIKSAGLSMDPESRRTAIDARNDAFEYITLIKRIIRSIVEELRKFEARQRKLTETVRTRIKNRSSYDLYVAWKPKGEITQEIKTIDELKKSHQKIDTSGMEIYTRNEPMLNVVAVEPKDQKIIKQETKEIGPKWRIVISGSEGSLNIDEE